MKRREKRRPESENQWVNAMCELLKGGVAAGLVSILTLLLCAVMVSAGVLKERWMEGAVLASCVAGALAGGMLAVLRIRARTLLVGLAVGGILFLLLLTAGFLAFNTASIEHGGVGVLCACLCGGGLAGLLGRKTPKKKHRR